MELYAHITQLSENDTEQRTQSLEAHSARVGELASQFADEFGCGDIAHVMGLLHDKGKEQVEWQKHIRGITGYNKEYAHIKQGPNHAYVGAHIAQMQYPQLAPLIAQPIAGHHRELYNYCDYIEETKREVPQDVSCDAPIPCPLPKFSKLERYDLHHLVRDFQQFLNIGAIEEPFKNIYAITNPGFYKEETGLTLDNQWVEETYIL